MQADDPVEVPHRRLRVVLPMGLFLVVGTTLARWRGRDGAVFDLDPYLPGPRSCGLLETTLREVLTDHAWLQPLLAAATALLLFLTLESLGRHVWRHTFEAAAVLPAAAFAVSPSQVALQRVAGGENLTLALACLLAGTALAFSRRPIVACLAAAAGTASAGIHPACLVLLPGLVACLAAGGHLPTLRARAGAVVGVLALGCGWLLLAGGHLPEPPLAGNLGKGRAVLAAEQLAASPLMASWWEPRDVLPTGFRALTGDWPAGTGLLIWGILFGWGLLVVGLSRGGVGLLLVLLAGAAPFFVPDWVPGERGVALLPLLPALAVLALVLSVIRGPLPRDLFIGIGLGLLCWSVWHAERDADTDFLHSRSVSFQLPWADARGAPFFAPGLEPDPVRLVLFAHDVARRNAEDPYVFTAGHAAAGRIGPGASVIDHVALERLRKRVVRDPGGLPSDLAAGEEELFEKLLPQMEAWLKEQVEAMEGKDPELWYDRVQQEALKRLPEAMEILSYRSRHTRVQYWLRSFHDLVRRLATSATGVGDLNYSVPLREALVSMTEGHEAHHAKARAILAIELASTGRHEEALEHLKESIPHLDRTDIPGTVARGTVARCLMTQGKRKEALELLNDAWSGISSRSVGSADVLRRLADPRSRDYWLVVELLVLRYELVKELDPALEAQARRDVDRALAPALSFGARTVPALAFKARFELLRGDRSKARRYLEELRALKVGGLVERVDRIDHARYRLLALRDLRGLLGPDETALRAALDDEISALDVY